MLEIRNVHKTFNPGTINEKHALNGVNLKLEEGDFVTVIGDRRRFREPDDRRGRRETDL